MIGLSKIDFDFSSLKKELKQQAKEKQQQKENTKKKSKPVSSNDSALFQQAMQGVTPLKTQNQAMHNAPKPKPYPSKTEEDEQQALLDMFSDHYDPTELQPGDMLSYCRPGIQHRVFGKLRSGEYRVAAEIDLHGLNSEQARQELYQFLQYCYPNKGECVRVIHGKGKRSNHNGPVLKIKVNKWLRQYDRVLAFHSARPIDGGTGAVYVLLKRN